MMHDSIHTISCRCGRCDALWREEVRGDVAALILGGALGTLICVVLIVATWWRPILTFLGLQG
ncbi:hypothetical protein FHS96_003065 [Sphingomonas zeicaulis]|uniref:hypothetical protein n=1 Tax=Sphingomonas zeicaulis TaxID=1632740 RepID=UPI003D1FA31B